MRLQTKGRRLDVARNRYTRNDWIIEKIMWVKLKCVHFQEGPGRRRSAVEVEAGDMQAAPARYVSASELYSTDEVELLLEEIRELEPTSCRGEDVQDFEIAGSGCAGAGGRSPAGTELTEHSWDSHAHYSRAPPPRPRALAPVYCQLSYLITPTGALTLVLVVSHIFYI